MDIGHFLLTLIAIFASAKIFGEIAERLGQPAVLGELVGGLVIGVSGLRLVDPHNETIHLLAELGVILLLFLIGLETDLNKLFAVGGSAFSVAVIGVTLPFVFGYGAGIWLGYTPLLSIFLGAALTATSVGITARVFSDLGRLQMPEAQVVLGAAVIDDVIGLVLLAVVSALARGETLSILGVSKIALTAFGFVIVAIIVGNKLAPSLVHLIARLRVGKALFFASVMFAFGLAFLAEAIGSAMIVGSFAAGLVLARTDRGREIEREVHDIAQFFIPIFFVLVGAAVDLKSLDPFVPSSRRFLLIGILLTFVAIVGKILAGWAALGRDMNKLLIGVGMIPRGEVGLIFAQIGLSSGLLVQGLYSSVAIMVMVTTMIAPPLLRILIDQRSAPAGEQIRGVASHVTEAPYEDGEEKES